MVNRRDHLNPHSHLSGVLKPVRELSAKPHYFTRSPTANVDIVIQQKPLLSLAILLLTRGFSVWALLDLNQWPLACRASALPG